METPNYWKTSVKSIEECIGGVRKGKAEQIANSAGGRAIVMIRYGEKNVFRRTANLSSALGAGDVSCYADKSGSYKPTVFLVGAVHGGEFEGTCALINLINILETGEDCKGERHPEFDDITRRLNLLIVPCANPDGRARVPFDSFVGRSIEELRYYNQGTWKDGSLCGWPECKKVHPIRECAGVLGAYFNDDGVNMMHDSFFGKKSSETQALFCIADEYVPDFTVLLHGGTDTANCILKPAYTPESIKTEIAELDYGIAERMKEAGIPYRVTGFDRKENCTPPGAFNLTSALSHTTGEPCVTYESNQGMGDGRLILSHDEIYQAHLILFHEIMKKYKGGAVYA